MADQQEPIDPHQLVIVLIGASAVGKSTIAEYLTDAGIVEPTPTWATRAPRPGEKDACYDHHFVSNEEYDRKSESGGFVDEQALYGGRYGIPELKKPEDGKEGLVVLKPVFMPAFLDYYPEARVYQIDADVDKLAARMYKRGQSTEDINERIRVHPEEAEDARRYAHVVFDNNGSLNETMQKVEAQIRADRAEFDAKVLSQA